MHFSCMHADVNVPYIVFEDLSILGYKNVDRRLGLDFDHYKRVLSKMAKWHAATAVLVNKVSSITHFGYFRHEQFFVYFKTLNFQRSGGTR